jgi:hypothetical protein
VAISSVFSWSSAKQANKDITKFQYVTFEQSLIGPAGNGWITETESGYTAPTDFIVPSNGFYLITYKLDVRAGGDVSPSSNTDCTTVLILNGVQIAGSTTLVEAPETNHIYTISNTVLVFMNISDSVSLMFWSTDPGTQIGDPTFIKGTLPNGSVPIESTASIVITKLSS